MGAIANLEKDSQNDFIIAGSKGISPNIKFSNWEKWLSMGDPFDTT